MANDFSGDSNCKILARVESTITREEISDNDSFFTDNNTCQIKRACNR
jgi:hypothetical protein